MNALPIALFAAGLLFSQIGVAIRIGRHQLARADRRADLAAQAERRQAMRGEQ